MKHLNLLQIGLLLLCATATPAFSQVSNDNEDEVNKIDQRMTKDFVPGQVLVKFKDASHVSVRRTKGKFQSASLAGVDAVLKDFGADDMEQLLPNEKPRRTLRKTKAFNGTIVQERDLSQLYLVKLKEENLSRTTELVSKLNELDEVEYAEPNYKLYTLDNTIDGFSGGNPFATNQWYLEEYGVTQLWDKPIVDGTRPVIAIIDTGVDLTHPDLVDNLWTNTAEAEGEEGYDNDNNGFKNDVHGWDFINNTPNIRDNNMHGTHVAGIAAAANNGIGIVGANPLAYIMPVSVMQSDGTGDVATIIKGVNYAAANGATVLNLSIGTYANSQALRQALGNAYQDCVIVAAAGNDHLAIYPECGMPAGPMFPAAYSFVLGVQAYGIGGFASFSNYDCDGPNYSVKSTHNDPDGFNYELKAPGVNILSTIPGGNYKALSGTSMASPLVAGAISALRMVKEYDNQETLWGDLLHTDNVAQAYYLTERPAELDFTLLQFRDRKELNETTDEDYSNDGQVDAGETVSIYPVIRTTFGEASNIKLTLEMGDEFEDPTVVDIVTPTADFGMHLDAYGKGVSLNPVQVKIADNVADNRHIKMKVVATCDESSQAFEMPFTLVVNNMIKIHGLTTGNMTLTADHVYYVDDNLVVMEGDTLTIEPGTRLEFAADVKLSSFGKLIANGTPEDPIVFTGHVGEAPWKGIETHESGQISHDWKEIYTNADSTLFTLLPTEQTPIKIYVFFENVYYNSQSEEDPGRSFYLSDYLTGGLYDFYDIVGGGHYNWDLSNKQHLLTDPSFLTPAVLEMLNDWKEWISHYQYEPGRNNQTKCNCYFTGWSIFDNPRDIISYCRIDGVVGDHEGGNIYNYWPYMKDCEISPRWNWNTLFFMRYINGERNVVKNAENNCFYSGDIRDLRYSNIVNNGMTYDAARYSQLKENNYFNNYFKYSASGKYYGKFYSLFYKKTTPSIDHANFPSYLGTSREDIVRPYIYEMGNAPDTYGQIDLSNMRTTPVPEAHGIVWKVVVNGYDAQDEFEQLPPLGVGKHKFEVYFNRPMNVAVAPKIFFGVRDPWTQHAVAEDGAWSADSLIYTAYITIDGKTKSDGINRIYVYGAEDNEYFECPYEKDRFNINIQAAGSMATGFSAEAGLGRVDLTWNNENNNFDDAMGFNVYRYKEYEALVPVLNEWGNEIPELDENGNYQYDENGDWIRKKEMKTLRDTVRINTSIIDVTETSFTDYDVTPGETYYYYYKVLSTDLQEYDISNVVAVTPLTASLGDANGDTEVDVSDVMTVVNYASGLQPKPFIFEAADINTDLAIDILDVIGIIQKILHPEGGANSLAVNEAEAIYTIEDGQLFVESPVALAGVQVQLAADEGTTFTTTETLKGFEQASAWLSDNDYLFLAFNMNGKVIPAGKHALLNIGDAEIARIRLSDGQGHNVRAIPGDNTTTVNRLASDAMNIKGIYTTSGIKITGDATKTQQLPKGVYIINGEKVVK